MITVRTVLFTVLLAAIVYAAFYAVRWYDTNAYYVQVNNNELMIYHGRIGGGVLYKPVEVERTGVTVADVPAYTVSQLITGVQEDSLKAAQSYVANLVATQKAANCTQSPTAPGCTPTTTIAVRLHRHNDDLDRSPLMERRIRWLGIAMVICFVALFVQLNNIQIVKAHALATSSNNPRVLALQRNDPRGDILSADGIVLASSVPSTSGYYKYQRVYNPYTSVLFSQIVGFDSIIFGKSGIEAEYDSYLQSHTQPAKSLRDLLRSRTTTGNVTLTISSSLQSVTARRLDATDANSRAPEAAAVVINVKTGAIEAMYGNPTYDPTPLASPNITTEKYTWAVLNQHPASSPLVSPRLPTGLPARFDVQDGHVRRRLRPPARTGQARLPGGPVHPPPAIRQAALQLQGQRGSAGVLRRGPHRHPARLVRHRVRHTGHGTSAAPR